MLVNERLPTAIKGNEEEKLHRKFLGEKDSTIQEKI